MDLLGLSIVGLGQIVITITEVLVVLMKEIINHHVTEFIMIREVHTALIILWSGLYELLEVIDISRSHRDSNSRDNRYSRGYISHDYRSFKNEDSRDYDCHKSDSYCRRSSSPTSSHKPSHPEKERRAERIEIRSILNGSIVERFQPSNWRSSHCYSRSPSPTHRRKESVSPRRRRGQSPYRLRPRVDVPSYYIREVGKKDGDIPYGN